MFTFTLWYTNIAMENQHFNRYIIYRRALFHSKLLILLAGISHSMKSHETQFNSCEVQNV